MMENRIAKSPAQPPRTRLCQGYSNLQRRVVPSSSGRKSRAAGGGLLASLVFPEVELEISRVVELLATWIQRLYIHRTDARTLAPKNGCRMATGGSSGTTQEVSVHIFRSKNLPGNEMKLCSPCRCLQVVKRIALGEISEFPWSSSLVLAYRVDYPAPSCPPIQDIKIPLNSS